MRRKTRRTRRLRRRRSPSEAATTRHGVRMEVGRLDVGSYEEELVRVA